MTAHAFDLQQPDQLLEEQRVVDRHIQLNIACMTAAGDIVGLAGPADLALMNGSHA